MVNLAIVDKTAKTPTSQAPSRPATSIINYTAAHFLAVQTQETTVDIIPVHAYRSVLITVAASNWGTATVAVNIYICDSQGNNLGSNALFSFSLTGNATTTVMVAEMGGTTTVTPYPPASPPSSGIVIGPFGCFLKITEQCTVYTSGTNAVNVELDCKG